MRRHELSGRAWYLVAPHTRGRLGGGRDNRQFINAVLYRLRVVRPAQTVWAPEYGATAFLPLGPGRGMESPI